METAHDVISLKLQRDGQLPQVPLVPAPMNEVRLKYTVMLVHPKKVCQSARDKYNKQRLYLIALLQWQARW